MIALERRPRAGAIAQLELRRLVARGERHGPLRRERQLVDHIERSIGVAGAELRARREG